MKHLFAIPLRAPPDYAFVGLFAGLLRGIWGSPHVGRRCRDTFLKQKITFPAIRAVLRARGHGQPLVESTMACRLRYWTHRRTVDLMQRKMGAAISSISSRGNGDEDHKQSADPRMLRAPLGELDNWGHDSRCSASIAGSLSRGSAHSRIAHAEAIVVSCDNRPTAVLAFFQYIRMGSAACAEQFDANRSFAVQACFHRAGYCTAPGELDRTPVGRTFRSVFHR
ncbi:hypothetical protein [Burkholderia latens]|uniref:hypothetical protein n=1 Tax=Burkholderia latens TaxID=488446 RepID=UPI001AEB7A60|nr:hypothetical protein [Burkholderia latens]QTO44951.1 hypothetical protein J8I85_21010 [Burkholderia latens]